MDERAYAEGRKEGRKVPLRLRDRIHLKREELTVDCMHEKHVHVTCTINGLFEMKLWGTDLQCVVLA
jgi:hypothetical protein